MAEKSNVKTRDDLADWPQGFRPRFVEEKGAATGTLARGLAIIDCLLGAGKPLALAEIADSIGLDNSTALRLLRNLVELGQVIRVAKGRKYLPSPRALRPLPLLHPLEQLRRETATMLYAFAAEVKMTAVLVIFLEAERLVVQVATGAGTLNPYYDAWLRGPLHGSGPGKALLMNMAPEERRSLLGEEPFARYTDRTILTWNALDADLAEARERGFALVRDEFYTGLSAMSCPFRSRNGAVAGCVALTAHSREFTAKSIDKISSDLIALCRLLPMQTNALTLVNTLCGR